MVIKLNDADFSANNVGKVELPIVIDPDIQGILSNYTKELRDAQKYAFQTFYRSLQSNGLLDKISNLYMPLLSGSVREAMFNVKAGVMDATNVDNNLYGLSGNGALCLYSQYTDDIDTPLTFPFACNKEDLHLMVYADDTDVTGNRRLCGAGSSSTSMFDLWSGVNSKGAYLFNFRFLGSTPVNSNYKISNKNGMYLVSVSNGTANLLQSNINRQEELPITVSSGSQNVDIRPLVGYNKKYCSDKAYIISAGSSFSKEQQLIYRDACSSFVDAIINN